jgi:ABC-type proline/glycine betaine transport system ATPase subunit
MGFTLEDFKRYIAGFVRCSLSSPDTGQSRVRLALVVPFSISFRLILQPQHRGRIAVVGMPGAGKSTLVAALARNQEGTIGGKASKERQNIVSMAHRHVISNGTYFHNQAVGNAKAGETK